MVITYFSVSILFSEIFKEEEKIGFSSFFEMSSKSSGVNSRFSSGSNSHVSVINYVG